MPDLHTRAPTGAEFQPHKTLDRTEARQAATTGHVRYVLAISLALCVVAFAVFYVIYIV
jgi:hypothetical protein